MSRPRLRIILPLLTVVSLAVVLFAVSEFSTSDAVLPAGPKGDPAAEAASAAGDPSASLSSNSGADQAPVSSDDRSFMPPPTEVLELKLLDKQELKKKREAWIEEVHRAAPGTDWRAIEEANRKQLIEERIELEKTGTRTSFWTEIGSANQAGRTHTAAYSPDSGVLYLGSDNGGVWKGTLAGESWTAISDDIGYNSHGLCLAPGSPEVITTFTSGGRIHATIDDGDTWFVPAGLEEEDIWSCIRMVRDLGSPRTVYLLVRGRHDVHSNGFHLYRSDDGGQNYTFVYDAGSWPSCDIWIDRKDPGPLYLMDGPELRRSDDKGQTFSLVGTIPISVAYTILTASEAGAPTFYAGVRENSGNWQLWRSVDGGVNWEFRYNINDFWETMTASITDPDLVLFAGVECWRSTNGGGSFTKVNNWGDYYGDPENKLHADFPGMECMWIDNQEVFFLDTDGGSYISYDGVETVRNLSLSGLGISQYYDIFTSANDPYLIVAGAQDQGYQQSLPHGEDRTPFLDFDQLISGDYGQITSTVRDHNLLYSVYPGFVLVQLREESPQGLRTVDFPSGANYAPWMPMVVADPQDPGVFYFTADHLWRYEDTGGYNWEMTELPYDFAADGAAYLTAFAIAPSDYNRWYAVAENGLLWYSTDAGVNWTLSDTSGPDHTWIYGTSLIVSPTDPLTAFVAGSGYSGPAVFRTVDGGATWEAMNDGMPATLVYTIAFDNDWNQGLYAATEAGPYYFDTGAWQWVNIQGTEAPMTNYWCVEGVPELGVVRFGTYGRGIWDYKPDYTEFPALVTGAGPAYDNPPTVNVFPPLEDASRIFSFDAYGATHYGVNVATGDLDGDDSDEIITGAGPGNIYGPHVRGFSVSGTPIPGLSFLAYGTNRWGVNVTAGDLDGDGFDEIVTGAGPGSVFGPHVRAFDYDGGGPVSPVPGVSYFAYGTNRWGVNVSAGDIDGDGFDEIITGAGPGSVFGPHVRGWNVDSGPSTPIPAVSFMAYGTFRYGVRVTCGDVDGDGIDEIVTAPGPSAAFGAHIRGWNYDGTALTTIAGINFFAWQPSESLHGANVFSGTDLDGDGHDEIIVGAGPDPAAGTPVKVFGYDGSQVSESFSLQAYPDGWTSGATVAGGVF